MIQQKTPKKIKGARKKRRIKEKEDQQKAIESLQKDFRTTVNNKILAEMMKCWYKNGGGK